MTTHTSEWIMQQVKTAAGIHMSSYKDEEVDVTDEEQKAIQNGATTMDPTWAPDKEWRDLNMAPAKPFEERGIKIIG